MPVPVGRQVYSDIVPHEADNAMVGHPRHAGLEVIHDTQGLSRPLEVIAGEVGDPHNLLATQVASLDIIHSDHGSAVHMRKETEIDITLKFILSDALTILPVVIFVFMKDREIHHSERYKLVIEHNILEVLLIEQPVTHSNLAKCLGP